MSLCDGGQPALHSEILSHTKSFIYYITKRAEGTVRAEAPPAQSCCLETRPHLYPRLALNLHRSSFLHLPTARVIGIRFNILEYSIAYKILFVFNIYYVDYGPEHMGGGGQRQWWELILSLYHMDSWTEQGISLGSKHLYLLEHLPATSGFFFFKAGP